MKGHLCIVLCAFNLFVFICYEAWLWKKHAHDMCLAGWFGNQHHRAIPHSAFLSLWTCCKGKVFKLTATFSILLNTWQWLLYLLQSIELISKIYLLQVVFDRLKGMALILYNNTDFAQAAVRETKGWKIGGNKIKVWLFFVYLMKRM